MSLMFNQHLRSMEMGPGVKVSSNRLKKPGIKLATPGLQGEWFIYYTMTAHMPLLSIIVVFFHVHVLMRSKYLCRPYLVYYLELCHEASQVDASYGDNVVRTKTDHSLYVHIHYHIHDQKHDHIPITPL